MDGCRSKRGQTVSKPDDYSRGLNLHAAFIRSKYYIFSAKLGKADNNVLFFALVLRSNRFYFAYSHPNQRRNKLFLLYRC
jgi:hypothetical protein